MSKPSATLSLFELVIRVRTILDELPMRVAYQDEQSDLQMHLAAALREGLPTDYEIVTSIGGRKKPSIPLFGTSFWPDIEIRSVTGPQPLVAIEVKYIRPEKRASKAIAECLGQALLYRERYQHVIAYILHDGKSIEKQAGNESACLARLTAQGIHLLLKRRSRRVDGKS